MWVASTARGIRENARIVPAITGLPPVAINGQVEVGLKVRQPFEGTGTTNS